MEVMQNEQSRHDRIRYSYRFGTAEFDEARCELRVADLPVEVEPRALEVLAHLLRHAGEVVTKDELLREVWAGRITVDKVLPNAIAKLRRALGQANAQHLVTQSRLGYRLDGPVTRTVQALHPASRLELVAGQPVPTRETFLLRELVGSTQGSEVWLAEQPSTGTRRVYKFALDDERLRGLKREATLARVLREGAQEDEAAYFVELTDWNFASPPFFLEYVWGGDTLLEWAREHLSQSSREARIALFVQIAEAVAAAHRIGVLHKDLKPANVLVAPDGPGWRVRLIDFGSGRLLDPDQLRQLGITRAGMTVTQDLADPSSGTPLYIAPELFDGQLPTTRSDIYALGIMLYQLLAGSLARPMASGWEQDIQDEVLCQDIRLATEGDPRRRLSSADELVQRLLRCEARQHEALQARAEAELARIERDALRRSRARRPWRIALILVLLAATATTGWLARSALQARNEAQRELARANALNRFLNEDLIGRSNPLVVAKGQDASLKDILLGARERVAQRFVDDPLTGATIHTSLAMLLNMVELLPQSEAEARRALALYEAATGPDSPDSARARALLARLLTRTGGLDESLRHLAHLEQQAARAPSDPLLGYLAASVRGIYHMNRGEFAEAVPYYRTATTLLRTLEPDNVTLRDSMRIDLINALTQTGDTGAARALGEELLREIATRQEDNGLVAAFTQAAVARTWTLDGELERAEAGLQQAADAIAALLGRDHSRHLMVLSDLYDIAMRRHDWPVARGYAQQVHDGFLVRLGDAHVITQLTRINLAQVVYEEGDAAHAAGFLRPAWKQLSTQLGPGSPQSQLAGFWLAAVELELGDMPRASELLMPLESGVLEAAAADGLWSLRLELLQALLMEEQAALAAGHRLDAAIRALQDTAHGGGRLVETAKRLRMAP